MTAPDARIDCRPLLDPGTCAQLVDWARPRVVPLPGRRPEQGHVAEFDEWTPVVGQITRHITEVNRERWCRKVDRIRANVIRGTASGSGWACTPTCTTPTGRSGGSPRACSCPASTTWAPA